MQYAFVDDERREAFQGGRGNCPTCGSGMLAKCGPRVIHHWAHEGRRDCDPWWENETNWHREWKNMFPEACREVSHTAPSGEKHIADVKTPDGLVIEFQHSYLDEQERQAREQFYERLIWVVDGTRLKRDYKFFDGVRLGRMISLRADQIVFNGGGYQITRRWMNSKKLVFLDFGDDDLWCVSPHKVNWQFFVAQVSKREFVAACRAGHLPPAAHRLWTEAQQN